MKLLKKYQTTWFDKKVNHELIHNTVTLNKIMTNLYMEF